MKCPSCDVDDLTGLYCSNCGARLVEEKEQIDESKQEEEVKIEEDDTKQDDGLNQDNGIKGLDIFSRAKKKPLFSIFVAICGIFLLILFVYMIDTGNKKSAESATKAKESQYQKGIQLMQEGKWKEASTELYFLQKENYLDSKNLYDEAEYQEGIQLLKDGKWQDATFKLAGLSIANYKDGKILYGYATARDYATAINSYNMANFTMKEIPDSYNGIMYEDILKYKNEIKEKKDTPTIEFVDCNWYRNGSYVYYNGKVKNNSSKSISFVKVEVVYYDKQNGSVIDSDYAYAVDSHPLQPGLVKSFNLMTPYSSGMAWAQCSIVSYQ